MRRLEVVDTVGNGYSVKDQLANKPTEELWQEMDALNKMLGRLGVEESISNIIYWGQINGCRYEDVHSRPGGPAMATAHNCMMTLLHEQPELRKSLSTEEFDTLGGLVARVSLTTEILLSRLEEFEWPQKFKMPPR